MKYMHFSIKVADFDKWKALMLADKEAQHDAGLFLVSLWRCRDDRNRAFFIMEAHSEEKARAFLDPARAEESKRAAGVLEFEWCLVEKEKIDHN